MKEQWIAHLMHEHSESLLRFLSSHTDNREDAEDLMQEIFTSCYKAYDRFDSSKCSEVAWLFIIAKNRLKNYYRDKKTSTSLDAIEVEQKDPTDYMAKAVHLMHCREVAAEVIRTLDERSQQIILLRFFEEKSHEEIAELLNLNTGNVRVIQSRALKQMEAYLNAHHADIRNIHYT